MARSLPSYRAVNFFTCCEIPTERQAPVMFILNGLQNGTPHAVTHSRRSGAQRGAPENNFGQRFSWAPLAIFAHQHLGSPFAPNRQ
jgi:hypothetical protein